MAGLAEPVNNSMFPSRTLGSSATKVVLRVRFCSGYPNPNRNIIKNGPNTRVRMSRGCRRISVSSLLTKAEIRIRNLDNLLIVRLLFDQPYKNVVEGGRYLFDGF